MFPCLLCNQCSCVNKSAVHPLTGRNYPLKGHFTCLSKFVVCPCGFIFMGETTLQKKTHITQHRSTIRRSYTKLPVSKHYAEKGHSDSELKFMVLEEVSPLRRGGGTVSCY
ncbi:hypothetical protein XELAEV_18008495mg [Xenopus laevis]|uniref:Uncharacterized protein n=1 Tax=Xenopus laevis TaxID=8355 RepID=A0A974E3D3_XENLA|nr:hypothetical protein XELAEV_18008495mg [Xenopus laevis]